MAKLSSSLLLLLLVPPILLLPASRVVQFWGVLFGKEIRCDIVKVVVVVVAELHNKRAITRSQPIYLFIYLFLPTPKSRATVYFL